MDVISKTVSFYLSDGRTHRTAAALSDFEELLLSRPEFLKTHRSYIVNLSYVSSVCSNCVIMKDGHNIPLSRLLRRHAQEAYLNYLSPENAGSSGPGPQTTVPEGRTRPDGLWRILLVDDDPAERVRWADILRLHGCVVRWAENGENALKLAAEEPFDCVLLDVMLPGESGYSICKELCRLSRTPVIFLSCLSESDRQVEGFAAGGVDYILKNTPAELFWTKVETRIRLSASDHTRLYYGSLMLDVAERRAFIREEELFLTPVEFELLRCLSEEAGQILSPRKLFDRIWGGQPWDGGQTVQTHISRLRRKLEKTGETHHFIDTVWGEGYRFVPL